MKNKTGFTIIEVLIVLAIAGLILIIVFLAVPALQRNSRNTEYRTDAARLLVAAKEFMNSNNGLIPSAADKSAVLAYTKTKSITDVDIFNTSTSPQSPDFSVAILDTGVQCPATVSGNSVTPLPSSGSALALIYAVEDASGNVVAQCIES